MNKRALKVYIETSVISGYGRQRFHHDLMRFFDMIRAGDFIPIISAHTLTELNRDKTPIEVTNNLTTIQYIVYQTTDEMNKLAEKYMERKIIVESYKDDALHIAIATVLKVDILVSWNLTHIVNEITIPLFNKVNIENGYQIIDIKKPEEIM
ncbi:MAG: hypothetical protein FWG98_08190 [Candidatus Cloacimonetes bacterium]|nr:hypothetical protein [Candidatus Cloacimonadota bacterium]